MLRYIIKRILWMIPVLLGVVLIVFTISYFTPGDPVEIILSNSNLSQEQYEEQYEALQQKMGLDKGFAAQYFQYVKNIVLHGDFGTSYTYGLPVGAEIRSRIWVSVKLGIISMFLSMIVGIGFGLISATKQYSLADYSVTVLSMFFAAAPGFWLAMMLILLFSVKLNLLPASGLNGWKNYILPVASMAMATLAGTTRMTRSSVLEVIRQDYIRTARAKGLRESVITRRHALKNALIPVITITGVGLGQLFGGSVIIENIFNIAGMGTYLLKGINNRDYPVILGVVLVLSACVCFANLLVDLCYALIDPRIRAQYESPKRKKKLLEKQMTEAAEGGSTNG